jgi:hypothetical protein
LPQTTRRLLLVAAAEPTGDPVLVWRAAGLLEIGMDAAGPAEADGLLTIGARVTFRHPLVRSAAYRAAAPEDRRAAHRALADATDPQADPDRRAWHHAQAAAGPDEDIASELERSAGRAQARGGFAAAAAFLERSAVLTPGPARRAERALAAAQAKYQAGAFDAALGLLAAAEAGPLDEPQCARADLLSGQITFASTQGSDAPALLLKAARRFEPLDPRLARETYLEALTAALFVGSLATTANLLEVAEAARAAPPPPTPARPSDLLVDGMAVLVTEGYPAGAPVLKRALSAFRAGDVSPEEGLWQACHSAGLVWDYDSWQVLADRQIEVARDAGALTALPPAFTMRAMPHLFAGEFTAATSMVAQVESVSQATGISIARYAALALAVFRGREAEAAELTANVTTDARRRGEGAWLPFVQWATAVLCNSLGHYEKALAAAHQVSQDSLAGLRLEANWALVELIEAAARSGMPDRAAGPLQRLAATTRASGTDWALGIEARARALVSDGKQADACYHQGHRLPRPHTATRRTGARPAAVRRVAAPPAAHPGGPGPAAPRPPAVHRLWHGGVRRTGPDRTARRRRARAQTHRRETRCPDRARGADRPPGQRRCLQRADRRPAVPQPGHRRVPPQQGVRQAGHQLARPARPRAPHPARRRAASHTPRLRGRADRRVITVVILVGYPPVCYPCLADQATDCDDGIGEVEERVDHLFPPSVAALQPVEGIVPGVAPLDGPAPRRPHPRPRPSALRRTPAPSPAADPGSNAQGSRPPAGRGPTGDVGHRVLHSFDELRPHFAGSARWPSQLRQHAGPVQDPHTTPMHANDAGGCRSNGPPIRQERSSVLKQHDPIAQQAPPLLKMTRNGACRDAIRCQGIGALWTMLALLVPRQPL